MLKLLIIGGGAVSESTHIPSAIKVVGIDNVYLAEQNSDQAKKIVQKFGLKNVFSDYQQCMDKVDGVIIATPPHIHNSILVDCIKAKLPVLCEKPLSPDSKESQCILTKNTDGVLLGICHTYRLFSNRLRIRELIREGYFGDHVHIEIQEGYPSGWPTVSGYCFRKDMVLGGVLFDAGIHSLDFILWCLGMPIGITYSDDEMGGLESNAKIILQFVSGDAYFRLSRTCELSNKIIVSGNGNTAELEVYEMNSFILNGLETVANTERMLDWTNIGECQTLNFIEAIEKKVGLSCPIADGLAVVEVIERCYKQKIIKVIEPQPFIGQYKNKKILVTGGTGFIGSRLTERLLLDEEAQVSVMVHKWSKAAWISRLDVNLIQADITSYEDVEKAVAGCEVVFHCVGLGGTREQALKINAEGTLNVLRACKKYGVKKIVYLSSVVVHGNKITDGMTAEAPFVSYGDAYADAKIQAENFFWEYTNKEGLNASAIRPTYVWGPLSEWYSVEYVKQMKKGNFYLVDEGNGSCNGVYVDNVVDLALICGVHPKAIGQSFIITDDEKLTWKEFFKYYADMLKLDMTAFQSIPLKDGIERKWLKFGKGKLTFWIEELWEMNLKIEVSHPTLAKWGYKAPRKLMKIALKWILKRFPEKSAAEMAIYNYTGFIDIQKVTDLLNYKPRFSVKEGMAKTKEWLSDQNYL